MSTSFDDDVTVETLNATLGELERHIGLQFVEASSARLVATFPVTPRVQQPYGLVHGGVHAAVVETIGSIGAAMWFGERGLVVGVSNSTDFYRGARDGVLTATGTPLHQGNTQQVWIVEIRDESEHLMARGQLRVQNLPRRD